MLSKYILKNYRYNFGEEGELLHSKVIFFTSLNHKCIRGDATMRQMVSQNIIQQSDDSDAVTQLA